MTGIGQRLVLIPNPFADETFGSWLHRCAQAYHTTVRGFANAVLALDGHPRITSHMDWDTAVPNALLDSLAAHSMLSRSELECLLAPAGPATLPKAFRDSYCPLCFQEDSAHTAIYMRRQWLDAWTIGCSTHGCLLCRFSALNSERFTTSAPSPQAIFSSIDADQVIRSHPTDLLPPFRSVRGCEFPMPYSHQPWLHPQMLKTTHGRDLMMAAGSEPADDLHRALFGISRPPAYVWKEADGTPGGWPKLRHPLAGIDVRICAAYMASALWHAYADTKWCRPYRRFVIEAMRATLAQAYVTNPLVCALQRLPRRDRERWTTLFS
jgi:hypothetical protein